MSGDNTVSSMSTAIKNITKEDADDYFVLVLSDANLHQYNISPKQIQDGKSILLILAIETDSKVNAYMVFIGNISNQADRLSEALGGNAYNCFNNKDLPKIMKSIFVKAMLK